MNNYGRGSATFDAFKTMFPKMVEKVHHYKMLGKDAIAIFWNDEKQKSLVFLYKSPEDWQLGTKLYRKAPKAYVDNLSKKNNEAEQPSSLE